MQWASGFSLVKAFIPVHRQERFLEIIAKPKKRAKLLTELSHFKTSIRSSW